MEEKNINADQIDNEKKVKHVKEFNIKKQKRNVVVALIGIIFSIAGYIFFRGNYIETLEIGEQYLDIYWLNIKYMSITLLVNFFIIFISIYLTNYKIKNTLKEFFKDEKKQMPKFLNKSIAFILGIIISLCTSKFILSKFLLCFSGAKFEIQDPVFDYDISYFMFQKPFIEMILMYILVLLIGTLIYSTFYYIITFNIFFEGVDRKAIKDSTLLKQITRKIRIIAILIAFIMFVKTQDIVVQKFLYIKEDSFTYSLFGAGFTDVTIKLWGYRLLSIIMPISVFWAVKEFHKGNTKRVIAWISVFPMYLVLLMIVTFRI